MIGYFPTYFYHITMYDIKQKNNFYTVLKRGHNAYEVVMAIKSALPKNYYVQSIEILTRFY